MEKDRMVSNSLDLDLFEASYAEYLQGQDFYHMTQLLENLLQEFLEGLTKSAYAAGYRAAGGIAPSLSFPFDWEKDQEEEEEYNNYR